MIEAIEERKIQQEVADIIYRNQNKGGNDNPHKETFSNDRKPSASSTLYRYRENTPNPIKQYQTRNNDLKNLNVVWYKAEVINNSNFMEVDPTEPAVNPKELSTTFIDKKLVVTSSSG